MHLMVILPDNQGTAPESVRFLENDPLKRAFRSFFSGNGFPSRFVPFKNQELPNGQSQFCSEPQVSIGI